MKKRSAPRGAQSHLTERENCPAHRRENQLKEKTSPASAPRGVQSHLTERIKPAPRHRRANLLKEELALMQSKLPLRYSFTAKINF